MSNVSGHSRKISKKEAIELLLDQCSSLTENEIAELRDDLSHGRADEYDELNLQCTIRDELNMSVIVAN